MVSIRRSLFVAALAAFGCGGNDGGGGAGGDGGDGVARGDAATCGAGNAECPPDPPAPVPDGKSWVLVFREEFDADDYDHGKLTPCFDWNYGGCTASFNQGREQYAPGQIQVAGGAASMVAEPLDAPVENGACFEGACTYAAGLLSTARPRADDASDYLYTFTYGYVETRLMVPGTQGFFTALWMLPADPSYDYATEIDIVEILGHDPSTIWMHYHYNNRSSSYRVNGGIGNNGACAVKDYSQDWVRFGLDWQPGHVAWYIDGEKCGEFEGTTSEIESAPMQLILNNMVDNQWTRDWEVATENQTQTARMEVDYIRVYQQE
jgi:hypothetical protein